MSTFEKIFFCRQITWENKTWKHIYSTKLKALYRRRCCFVFKSDIHPNGWGREASLSIKGYEIQTNDHWSSLQETGNTDHIKLQNELGGHKCWVRRWHGAESGWECLVLWCRSRLKSVTWGWGKNRKWLCRFSTGISWNWPEPHSACKSSSFSTALMYLSDILNFHVLVAFLKWTTT